jgi:hypothetical protein
MGWPQGRDVTHNPSVFFLQVDLGVAYSFRRNNLCTVALNGDADFRVDTDKCGTRYNNLRITFSLLFLSVALIIHPPALPFPTLFILPV